MSEILAQWRPDRSSPRIGHGSGRDLNLRVVEIEVIVERQDTAPGLDVVAAHQDVPLFIDGLMTPNRANVSINFK
jgi:hypothetical protein